MHNHWQLPQGFHLIECRHGVMLANEHDHYIGNALIQYGEYSESELEVINQLIDMSAGCVVEIGANIGSLTVPMARRAAQRGLEMYAYEPQPFVFQNLCANLALNMLTNVRAYPFACGAQPGVAYMQLPDYFTTNNFGAVELKTDQAEGSIAVRCVTLDHELEHQKVGLMKIDVEGWELPVLQGARRTIERCRPILYFENDRLAHSEALMRWVLDQGYRLWWHKPVLHNDNNFRNNPERKWANVVSVNMIGIPQESGIGVQGFEPALDPTQHKGPGTAP